MDHVMINEIKQCYQLTNVSIGVAVICSLGVYAFLYLHRKYLSWSDMASTVTVVVLLRTQLLFYCASLDGIAFIPMSAIDMRLQCLIKDYYQRPLKVGVVLCIVDIVALLTLCYLVRRRGEYQGR